MDIVKPILEPIIGAENVTEFFIRKLAHFIEFFILGCELAAFLIVRIKVHIQDIVNCSFFGFFVASIDETIQIFTGRGSQIQDVWLDFTGVMTGIVIILLLFWFIKTIRKKYEKNLSKYSF